jgi:transposase InsO family protein
MLNLSDYSSYHREEFITNLEEYGFQVIEDLVPLYDMINQLRKGVNLSNEAKQRLKWFDYHRKTNNVSLTCRYYGISRKTFYKWYSRYDAYNLSTLEDQDRAPIKRRQREITHLQEHRIVSLRKKYIRESKFNIAIYYQREYGETISSWKVQKVIEKYNLYYHPEKAARTRKKRQRAVKKKRITELRKKKRSGYLIQVDTIVIWYQGIKQYIITGIDVFSKLAFARFYKTHSSYNAADFLLRLNYLFQDKIENIQTDNGSEFAKYFDKGCEYLKIEHYFSRNRTPKDLAVLERFNRTLQEQFLPGNLTTDIPLANQKLTEWLIHNNLERPHQSLGYLTPIEFHQKHNRVLPMYSSRTWGCQKPI